VECFRDGYDGRIGQYIRQHGLPPNSRKQWEDTLFDLQGYWGSRETGSSIVVIEVDGPAVRSPDGTFSVRFARMPYDVRSGGEYLLLAIAPGRAAEIRRNAWPIPRDSRTVQCRWGPAGSDVAILLWETRDEEERPWVVWEARDLRSGRQLRREWRPKEAPGPASAR